jgi:hypothetical protein
MTSLIGFGAYASVVFRDAPTVMFSMTVLMLSVTLVDEDDVVKKGATRN